MKGQFEAWNQNFDNHRGNLGEEGQARNKHDGQVRQAETSVSDANTSKGCFRYICLFASCNLRHNR